MKSSAVLLLFASCALATTAARAQLRAAAITDSCGGSTATFTNVTPVGIPAPGTITSTIFVSGAEPYLLDIKARTFLAHSRNGHLQVSLTSPAGTIATLTTNNGGSFANVYNGTEWNDHANPGGQVPYDFNAGVVTDHPYVNGVVATPLVPEEAMGAFIGENPNGLWTLTIADGCIENPPTDTCTEDAGALTSWSLGVTSLPSVPASSFALFRNLASTDIPFGPSVTTTSITVSGLGSYLGNLRMFAYLAYPVCQDLDVTLRSPAGTVATITTDNGGGFEDEFDGTNWFDKADPDGQIPYANDDELVTDRFYQRFRTADALVPEEAMSAFNGENPNGVWTLTISVDAAGHRGGIDEFDLSVTTIDIPGGDCTLTCPGDVVVSSAPGQCRAQVTYPPPTPGPCCGAVTCTPASGSSFPAGTTAVVCSTEAGQTCSFNVTVEDQTPPVVNISAKNNMLWPPNHIMVNVGLLASAADLCDPNASLDLAVFGDEDDEMPTGDGNFSPDALDVASASLRLRAERRGDANGRVYLIIGKTTDASSNSGYGCATVLVPHSQSKEDIDSVIAQGAAARAYCLTNGTPPPGFVVVGDGPVIGPRQWSLNYDLFTGEPIDGDAPPDLQLGD